MIYETELNNLIDSEERDKDAERGVPSKVLMIVEETQENLIYKRWR